ncbi:MAG: N-formylglutamate amidohydrolase [Phycisphaerales bacterium]|nr:MAG: N-formylglutamate amidohydrolase [Phycisphaerales bacterium]
MPEALDWLPEVVVLSCEHGGHEVPAAYAALFRGARDELRSHRGWDPGALGVARRMAERTSWPLIACTFTRLLVEPNRSPDSPQLFSAYTRRLGQADRQALLSGFYHRHRGSVERTVLDAVRAGRRVLHVAVHTCVDELDGRRRALEVGLLMDPSRPAELGVCRAWRRALAELEPAWRLPFNEPYLGTDDGLTTWLRTRLPTEAYAGVEVEVRQGLVARRRDQRAVGDRLAESLGRVLGDRPACSTGPAQPIDPLGPARDA